MLYALTLNSPMSSPQRMTMFGLLAAAGFSVYQQVLIFGFEKPKCFKAFLNNNWFGVVVFFGVFLSYLL